MIEKRYFFATRNVEKLKDVLDLVGHFKGVRVDQYEIDINERQTNDAKQLIEEKLVSAYQRVKRPTIVDHTCLRIGALEGLPGTQTSLFWEKLGGQKICEITSKLGRKDAEVEVFLSYTDGSTITTNSALVKGTIANIPKGKRNFQWDSIFIPTGATKTYAEMSTSEKNDISPRATVFKKFILNVSP